MGNLKYYNQFINESNIFKSVETIEFNNLFDQIVNNFDFKKIKFKYSIDEYNDINGIIYYYDLDDKRIEISKIDKNVEDVYAENDSEIVIKTLFSFKINDKEINCSYRQKRELFDFFNEKTKHYRTTLNDFDLFD